MEQVGTFLERLYKAMAREPFRRKLVLAPSAPEGLSWLTRVCRELGPLLQVEVLTVPSLIRRVTAYPLHRQEVMLIGEHRSFWLLHHLMERLAGEADSYIGREQLKPGIAQQVCQAILELRHAGVRAKDLSPEAFLSESKGRYVCRLLAAYEQELYGRRWTDFAGLLPYVPEGLQEDVELILPEPMELSPAALRMLERLSGGRLTRVAMDVPLFDRQTLPLQRVELYHAAGRLAEVREALRRIMEERLPLDQVELIISDAGYGLALSTLCAGLELPCTFAEGHPVEVSRTGRAAYALLEWLSSDYPVSLLVSMIRQQLLSFVDREESDITNADCVKALEQSRIGWGKERYVSWGNQAEIADLAAAPLEERELRLRAAHRQLSAVWRKLFPDHAAIATPVGLWSWLVQQLGQFGVRRTEEDAAALQEMKRLAEELKLCPMPEEMSLQQALAYVRGMLEEQRVAVKPTPEPGALHVSSLRSGGLSGRKHVFLLGMDEHAWSGSIRQNPMLLDEERRRIDAGLLSAAQQVRERQRIRDMRLGLLNGRATFSFSSYDLAEGTAASPAFQLLQVYRMLSGNATADYVQLLSSLGQPVGYFHDEPAGAGAGGLPLDAAQALYVGLQSGGVNDRERQVLVEAVYPLLGQGRRALEARSGLDVTAYDGHVAGEAWQEHWMSRSDRPISPSQLEKYAKCPMRYFYQYGLGVYEKERLEFDRTSWLPANEKGSLLHEVYREYMTEVGTAAGEGTGGPAGTAAGSAIRHDHSRLRQLAEETIRSYAERIPAPSPHVFEKERQSILRDVDVFYRMEAQGQTVPRFLEQELEVEGEPLFLELGEELAFPLRGIVDRMDETGPHQYRIIDYKTGSPRPYSEKAHFAGGSQLQHALYAWGTELWLRRTGLDPEAQVLESAYVFASERGQGHMVARSQEDRSGITRVVSLILRSMEKGLFVPASDPAACRYCEYAAVCGEHAQAMAEKRKYDANAELLSTLMEVEAVE